MKKLILALAVLSCRPALAYLPPDLSLRRTELVQILPYAQVVQLQTWVDEQPLLLSPAAYLQKLYAQFPERSLAWTFYASWEYLDRLEKTQQSYDQRDAELERAEDLLSTYIERCHEGLRGEVTPAQPGRLEIAPAQSRPELEETDEHLKVFRPLPWPERGYTREQVIQLAEAAQADLIQAQVQRARLEEAKKAFVGRQDIWTAWLMDVAQASQKYTQGQYQKPFDDSLPPPPQESLPAPASQ